MSGLVGWVDFRRDLSGQKAALQAMTRTMRDRGPDAEGQWLSRRAVVGHRRLRVADSAGGQPALAETGKGVVVLVYSGEVYNLDDLRRQLAAPGAGRTGRSDTEILLNAYLRWGESFVDRLNGMFAFAVWDEAERRLLLGRDRLGVKPLYYSEHPGGIVFASEPKGILASPLLEPRLDFAAIPILLQPRLALPGETPLKGLREVPPAHIVSYTEKGLSLRRYWTLRSEPHHASFPDTARRVRQLIEEAVGRQLTADAGRGAMLSGGLDSTSVAALAARAVRCGRPDGPLATFCLQFAGDSEHFVATELRPEIDGPYAAAAAAFLGTRHRTVTATTQDLLDVVPQTRRARDLPGWGQFDASMYLLFREMRRDCRVALTGEAADEIFGGYPYLFKQELIARDRFPWLGDGPGLSGCLSPELTAQIDPQADERARYSQLIADVPRLPGESPHDARMREVLYLGMCGPLAVILDRKDRMSAALGLQVRLPFCDHSLVEYVWNVPWSMKSQGGVKGLLKAAMKDILPASTLERRKSAYPHVQHRDYDELLIREAKWAANDPSSPVAGMFDRPGLNALIDELAAVRAGGTAGSSFPGGGSAAYMLIHLVETARWIDEYRVCLR